MLKRKHSEKKFSFVVLRGAAPKRGSRAGLAPKQMVRREVSPLLSGFVSILTGVPLPKPSGHTVTSRQRDLEAIAGDWSVVGRDIVRAAKQTRERCEKIRT